MNFGNLLRELLDISGLKQVQLASYLGYDVSYISRWLNNIKLPSIKNNGELLHCIAEFFAKNSDEDIKNRISTNFGYKEILSFTEYETALFNVLKTAYYLSENTEINNPNLPILKNNCCLSELNISLSSDNIIEAFKKAGNDSNTEVIEVISIPTLEDFYKDNTEMFWKNLHKAIPEKKLIHVRHAIDIKNISQKNTSQFNQIYRDIIIFYSGLPNNIVCDVYDVDSRLDNSRTLLICKDTFLTMGIPSVFTEQDHIITTDDENILDKYYQLLDNYFRCKTPLMLSNTYEKLNNINFFTRFLLGQNFKFIFCVMPPIYMDDKQKKYITNLYDISPSGIYMQDQYSQLMETKGIIIYKSSLIDYLITGTLYAYGLKITLSQEERLEHINFLIDKLEKTDTNNLIIIDDNNPILSRNRIDASFYINNNSMFIVKHNNEKNNKQLINYCTDPDLIHNFEHFFKQFQELDLAFSLSGNNAIKFIKNATKMIFSNNK